MYLKQLHLIQYRNYQNVTFDFIDGINYIVGQNAQGKTNLLESIYYLSTTKTHRNVDDTHCIREGYDSFKIDADLIKKERSIPISCILSKSGKNLFLYRNPVKKVSDFVGFCNATIFSPDDMNLFSAQPKVRRRFIDIELGKCSKTYMATLNEYMKYLKERNAYLKNEKIDRDFLRIYDDKCAVLQCIIIQQRKQFLHDLVEISQDFYRQLSDDDTELSLVYKTFVEPSESKEILKERIIESYEQSFERDCMFKVTEKGIHKDDFSFLLNGKNAEEYASQGQKRTILLALKIGMIRLIEKIIHDQPILLLDDVFSELDEKRRTTLLRLLPEHIQIFISTTDYMKESYNRPIKTIVIENGMKTKEDLKNG